MFVRKVRNKISNSSDKIGKLIKDERGNVLLFTIVCMLFLVFICTMLSVSIVNRVSIIRKVSDSNQLSSQADQKNAHIENSIAEILNQNDEMARYYVSQRFFENDDTNFQGKNADLDLYLKGLIQPLFQAQIRYKNLNGSLGINDLTNVLFAYLSVVRVSNNDVNTEPLLTYSEKIRKVDANDNSLSISSIQINANGLNSSNPTFDEIERVVKGADGSNILVTLHYNTSYSTPDSKNLKDIITYTKFNILPYAYKVSGATGIDIIQPTANELKNAVLIPIEYIVEQKGR